MVPNGLLRQWFEQHGAEEFDPDWDRLGEREVDPMLDFLTDLPPARSAELEKELGDHRFGTSPVHDVVLYQSILRPQGAQYQVLQKFPLSGAR
jgi:hypothetical protein